MFLTLLHISLIRPTPAPSTCLNQTTRSQLIIKFCLIHTSCTSSDPGGEETVEDAPCDQIISRQLTEQGRFAYAALCGVSLGQLFTGPENR